MAVSAKARLDLLKQGIPEFIEAYICSACKKSPDEMDRCAPHALQAEYDAQEKRAESSTDEVEEIVRIRLSKLLKNSSRCCGAPFERVQASYHQILWNLWQERISRVPESKMARARYHYGPGNQYRSDDFIRMDTIYGLGDGTLLGIVDAFTKEEARLRHAATEQAVA